jgi:hypothetical protein
VIDYPHRLTRYLDYLVAALLTTSEKLVPTIRAIIQSVAHLFGRQVTLARECLFPFLALGTLCRTPLLTAGFDERSRAAAIASAGKLIAQHLDLCLKLSQLRSQHSVLSNQFFAGWIAHTSHLDNHRKILLPFLLIFRPQPKIMGRVSCYR